jgi:hypothetical protein
VITRRAALLACALALLSAACTSGPSEPGAPASLGSPATASAPTAGPSLGPRSRLCQYPRPRESPPRTTTAVLPAPVRAVADEVTRVRELSWVNPVVPQAVSQERLGQILRTLVERSLPRTQLARETRAWIAIGALPAGASLRTALLSYASNEVVGFYDTLSHRLVYSGSTNPSPYQRYVLSHELTHALDDQRFDLSRADALQYACRDEPLAAFVALMEGDAVYTSGAWAQRFLSGDELDRLQQEAAAFPPPPASVPPFVQALQEFPYPNGLAFVRALVARGGEAAVNAAFRNPPVSTEQILHPERYPSDRPVLVAVAKPAGLGAAWKLIDQMEVGEAWLRLLLRLRLSEGQSADAAAGWGGAEYEAWAKGASVVVRLNSVWDTAQDASTFATALRSFVGTHAATVTLGGRTVTATFASDAASLAAAGGWPSG